MSEDVIKTYSFDDGRGGVAVVPEVRRIDGKDDPALDIIQLANIFYDPAECWEWLTSPHALLLDETPLAVVATGPDGAKRVAALLQALESGAFV